MSRSLEFDPVDAVSVGAVGSPGQRQFFLRARSGSDTVILNCEKFHVQGLVARVRQLLEAQGLDSSAPAPPAPPAPSGQADWTIGELGLGYHESRQRFVIVARERALEAEAEAAQPTIEPATARFWATGEQVRAFAGQAEAVLAGGRALCKYCGLPVDPSGHPCPAANGTRPIF